MSEKHISIINSCESRFAQLRFQTCKNKTVKNLFYITTLLVSMYQEQPWLNLVSWLNAKDMVEHFQVSKKTIRIFDLSERGRVPSTEAPPADTGVRQSPSDRINQLNQKKAVPRRPMTFSSRAVLSTIVLHLAQPPILDSCNHARQSGQSGFFRRKFVNHSTKRQ